MEKTIIKYGDIQIGKKAFKYFISYKDSKSRSLNIFLPKMSTYGINFDEIKYMYFLIKSDRLLEKYEEILGKVKNSIKKEFDGKPVYNGKYLKAKLKYSNEKINTNLPT